MKTFVKIALISMIAAFAVLSCEPEVSPHNEWWGEYNKQFDGSVYIGAAAHTPASTISNTITTGADKVNTITITFDETADVLKHNNPEPELKKFLSFWTFDPSITPGTGEVTALNELTGWVYQKRLDNQLTIDLKTIFATPCSGVVVKIDGTKYTYSNGKKMDRDGNGITGEKHYDDFYNYQSFTDSSGAFVQPENIGWTVTMSTDITGSGLGTTDTTLAADLTLASLSSITSGITQADRDDILKSIMGGFKVEKFSGGAWSNYAEASFDETNHRIIAKGITYSHMTGYRIVFEKGKINLETEKEFYGVKQRIRITDGVETIYNTKRNVTRLEGGPKLYWNNNKRTFNSPTFNITVHSKDGFGKNVVLKLNLNTPEIIESSSYYFKAVDLATFKNNFKIYESAYSSFDEAKDRREIGITAVEFIKEENSATDIIGDNVIYITLDPNYQTKVTPEVNKNKYFYIGDGIGYKSDIGVFSSNEIWKDKGFKAYKLITPVF